MKWLDVRSAHQSADTDPDVPAARLISGSSLAASAMPLPAAYQWDGHDPVHGLVPLAGVPGALARAVVDDGEHR